MHKRIPIAVAALLAACGAAASSDNSAAESKPTAKAGAKSTQVGPPLFDEGGAAGCFSPSLTGYARRVAERMGSVPCDEQESGAATGGGDGWAGTYEGQFDGGEGEVVLSGPSPSGNNYDAQLSVAGGGCSGQASASAAPRGNVLTLEIPTGNMADNNAGLCRITLRRQGNALKVSESGCAELHGMSCGFSGSASRKGAVASVPAVRSPAGRSIVGGWADSRENCLGDTGITYQADGTYSTYGESGRWQLSGSTLTHIALETDDVEGESTRIQNPRPFRSQLVSLKPNAFSHRGANGLVQLVRCS